MSTSDIAEFWKANFPGCPAVAHLLRDAFPHRWVRFHSLPESQRYPNDESEMLIVLDRHNIVLGELASPEDELTLLSTGYSDTCEPVPSELVRRGLFSESSHWESIAMHKINPQDDGSAPNYWHVFQSVEPWRRGAFDSVLRLVAQDEIGNIMIGSTAGGWLYHPYDGGADVILPTEGQRDMVKDRHRDWLSKHPEGL